MSVAARIRERLAALEPVDLDLVDESEQHRGHAGYQDGGGTHWRLSITSPRFSGQPTVARHRMVYSLLDDEMKRAGGIHALQLSTRTPEEEAKRLERVSGTDAEA